MAVEEGERNTGERLCFGTIYGVLLFALFLPPLTGPFVFAFFALLAVYAAWELNRSRPQRQLTRRRLYWIRARYLWWLSLSFLCISAYLVIQASSKTENEIRLWGMILQIAGMTNVVFDLIARAKQFGRPGLWTALKLTLFSWPKASDRADLAAEFGLGLEGSAFILNRRRVDPNASVEERLATIAANLAHIDKDILELRIAVRDRVAEIKQQISEEISARKSEVAIHARKLEEVSVGSLGINWFAVVWLFAGILFSTSTPEIVANAERLRTWINHDACWIVGCTSRRP